MTTGKQRHWWNILFTLFSAGLVSPSVLEKINRLNNILRMSNKGLFIWEIAERLHVSDITIKRDIYYLRDTLKIPLRSYRRNGLELLDKDFHPHNVTAYFYKKLDGIVK